MRSQNKTKTYFFYLLQPLGIHLIVALCTMVKADGKVVLVEKEVLVTDQDEPALLMGEGTPSGPAETLRC